MMVDHFVDPILRYIVEHHLGAGEPLDRHTPLFEWGIIDSFTIMDVLSFLEERFGIEIPPAEVTPDNIRDVDALANLLSRLSARTDA